MFEMIRLLIGTLFLFALAAVVGIVYAAVTFAILWKRPKARKRFMLLGAAVPVVSVAYMWICVAVLPGESLFGDINEPLPNGYSLEALGKMPDFASIKRDDASWSKSDVFPDQCIGRVAVDGNLVVGQYSHPFGSFNADQNEPFFAFDTISAKNIDYTTQAALESALGKPITLVETQYFRSQEQRYVRRMRIERLIEAGPPFMSTIVFFIFAVKRRLAQPAQESDFIKLLSA